MKNAEQLHAEMHTLRKIAAHPDTDLMAASVALIIESALRWATVDHGAKPPHKEFPIAMFILRGDLAWEAGRSQSQSRITTATLPQPENNFDNG